MLLHAQLEADSLLCPTAKPMACTLWTPKRTLSSAAMTDAPLPPSAQDRKAASSAHARASDSSAALLARSSTTLRKTTWGSQGLKSVTVTEVTAAVRTTPHGSAPGFESAGGTSQLLPLCGWPPSFRALIFFVLSARGRVHLRWKAAPVGGGGQCRLLSQMHSTPG